MHDRLSLVDNQLDNPLGTSTFVALGKDQVIEGGVAA